MRSVILLAALLTGACASKQVAGPLGDSTEQSLRNAEAIGLALFHLDELSARGTDVLLAAVKEPDKPVQGYLALGQENRVDFLASNGNEVVRFYSVDFSTEPATLTTDSEDIIGGEEAAMFKALLRARDLAAVPCERPYNTAVLRAPNGTDWLVYFLAATTDPNEVMIGGHVRVRVDSTGSQLEAVQPLSKSCLTLQKQSGPEGSETVGMVVTHSGPLPTEVHVFVSLLDQIDLYVLTEQGKKWAVEQGRIRELRE